MICEVILFALVGLIIGSFLGAFTFRYPRKLSVIRGRSVCPRCKKIIAWFDNVPLFSFVLLSGRCRRCSKRISFRYPLIEFSTASVFVLVYLFFKNCSVGIQDLSSGGICLLLGMFGNFALPYLLLLSSAMVAVFVIDYENQIIPDELVLFLYFLTGALLLDNNLFYGHLFSGYLMAFSLLLLNLLTRGRGMGLGDVKLALLGGTLLGLKIAIVWLFLSFVIGAFVGVFLIVFGKATFGKQIAFGPFMVISLFLVLLWGAELSSVIIPFDF